MPQKDSGLSFKNGWNMGVFIYLVNGFTAA